MSLRLLAVGCVALAGAAGCRIGEGHGEVKGSVFIEGCLGSGADRTNYDNPDFDLGPTFFAAEQIDDSIRVSPQDKLYIRIQGSGANVWAADALLIDVLDLQHVAAHMGEWIPVHAAGDLHPGTPTGQQPTSPVRVVLSLLRTCSQAIGTATVGVLYADTDPSTGEESVIRFTRLGSLACSSVDDGGASGCTVPENVDTFGVDFGDHIAAQFALHLVDPRPEYLGAEYPARVSGFVTGSFDFIMRRGRVAQPFP